MKRFNDLSYRNKLLITNLIIVFAVVLAITTIMTLTASRQTVTSNTASLNLMTEQALLNFITKEETIRQHLYATGVNTGSARQMALMRTLDSDSNAYRQARQDLIVSLSKMVDTAALYDSVSVRLDNGECVSNASNSTVLQKQIEALLMDERYAANQYGASTWVRTQSNDLFLLRDVYVTGPLRHVGRIGAHIKEDVMVSLGQYSQTLHYTLLFFGSKGNLITIAGDNADSPQWDNLTLDSFSGDRLKTENESYSACIHKKSGWVAVGLLPMKVLNRVQISILESSILVALMGIAMGLLISTTVSARLSRQIHRLVSSTNKVSAGDLDAIIPVESQDDIGILTSHFNRMTIKIKELLDKVVQEETNKRQAEHQNLEYEYRFLQWQINPHFIYNALETVNALAKLDGNDELCDMIVLLSSYFRQNAETMRKRFVTVQQEFKSLMQYVEIYRHIYGDTLSALFEFSQEAGQAMVPTMIIQPLLENALIHGANVIEQTCIQTIAEVEGDVLLLRIKDNGAGMTDETIAKLLGAVQDRPQTHEERTSLGVRNVMERLQLIYGDFASLSITSQPGVGTCVEMRLPLSFTDWK
ncbi:MAG: histidine kinase, partial [Clostridiales bacterium]|nr:histidine kinase [Clostridiales bacterium]